MTSFQSGSSPARRQSVPAVHVAGRDLIDIFLPPVDSASLKVRETEFDDDGVRFKPSAVDQMLAEVVCRSVHEGERSLLIQVPRGEQNLLLLTSIYCQIMRLAGTLRAPGPIAVAALDLKAQHVLGRLVVANGRRMHLGAGNPLSVHFVTGDGNLRSLKGSAGDHERPLLFMNSRVGWPTLVGQSPTLMFLDAVSLRYPHHRDNALRWADTHHVNTVVAFSDLGDDSPVPFLRTRGEEPLVLPLTWDDLAEIANTAGASPPAATSLCSNHLLCGDRPATHTHEVSAPDLETHLRSGIKAIAMQPPGEPPRLVKAAQTLIWTAERLASHPDDYATAAVDHGGKGAYGVATPHKLLRDLQSDKQITAGGQWAAWLMSSWADLRFAAEMAWNELERGQPKLDELWVLLERLARSDGQIRIRGANRVAVEALRTSLNHERRSNTQMALWNEIADRVQICRFADRFSYSERARELLVGVPPPWMFPLLVGGEATEIHVLTYDAERVLLDHASKAWAEPGSTVSMGG